MRRQPSAHRRRRRLTWPPCATSQRQLVPALKPGRKHLRQRPLEQALQRVQPPPEAASSAAWAARQRPEERPPPWSPAMFQLQALPAPEPARSQRRAPEQQAPALKPRLAAPQERAQARSLLGVALAALPEPTQLPAEQQGVARSARPRMTAHRQVPHQRRLSVRRAQILLQELVRSRLLAALPPAQQARVQPQPTAARW